MKALYSTGLLIVLLAAISGCGAYSFSMSGKAAFESLNVEQFENNTIEYQLSDRLTDAVIDAFINDNKVQIKEPSKAEAIMSGTVVSYRRVPHTYDQNDIVTEYAVKVTLKINVVKADSEDVIWEEEFFAEGIYDANTEAEEDGQNRAVEQLTVDILNHTTQSW